MSTTPDPITESEFLAYADGQVDPTRRAAVETFLSENPAKAAEIAEWKRQNEAIRALYDHVAHEPVPPPLSVYSIARNLRRARTNIWQMAAAAAVVFTLGSGLGWSLHGSNGAVPDVTGRLIASAVQAHQLFVIQKVHPVEVAASDTPHLTAWLSNSLDRRLVMPDLKPAGLQLVGGRLLPSISGSAAQIMYETASGKRATLYITQRQPGDQGTTSFENLGDVSALYWATPSITCTIVGNFSRTEMQTIANDVFSALSPGDGSYRRS